MGMVNRKNRELPYFKKQTTTGRDQILEDTTLMSGGDFFLIIMILRFTQNLLLLL